MAYTIHTTSQLPRERKVGENSVRREQKTTDEMKSDRPSKIDYRSRRRLKTKQHIKSYPPKQKSGKKYSGTEKRLTD